MAAPTLTTGLRPLFVQNRKFIGSKYNLLEFIAGVVGERAPEARSVADLFCGTGVVAHHFASRGMRVIASDTLYHNWLATRCFIGGRPGEVNPGRIVALLEELGALEPVAGYCAREYGGTYFTLENASRIDAIREAIASWAGAGAISEQEHAVLVTSLIYAADKVANTCGQYDAFLKHLGSEPYSADGVHRVDVMVYKRLELGVPAFLERTDSEVYCGDANDVVGRIACDVLYLDPPYNSRQYVDNYHVLENIARWEKPPLKGKTRKFDRGVLKSPYSKKRTAAAALTDLIARADCRHILLSYNNEGIVPDETILAALALRGEPEVFARPYAIFGNGAGRSGRRPIQERLFYCKVTRPVRHRHCYSQEQKPGAP